MNLDSLQIKIPNESEMLKFGAQLASVCEPQCLIYLHGNLGAGKTTLVRGFLQGLGYQQKVKSPTYTLIESYLINHWQIFHFDLYRVHHPIELENFGIRDYLAASAICLIEWPEQGEGILPPPDLSCDITHLNQERLITLRPNSAKGQAILSKLRKLNETLIHHHKS